MSRPFQTALCLAPLALLAHPVQAQDLRRMVVSDAGADVPGATRVERLDPPLGAPSPAPTAYGPTIPQLPGWPVTVGGNATFAPTRGMVFADLDGNGQKEVVVSSTDGKLYAFDLTGAPVPGFPVTLIQLPQRAPSVADIDADGDLEIVQFTRGTTSGGRMYVLDHQGNVLPGFPKSFGNNNVSGTPTLSDLDDDGFLEILVPERAYPIGYLHVVELDGSEWGGNWPVALDHVPTGAAAVGDVDADGAPEIAYLSYDSMYLLEVDGSPLAGWPVQIANGQFSYQSPALADLDGDGDLELAVAAHWNAAGTYVFEHTGALVPGWPRLVGTWSYCPPTVVDLDGDGALDVLCGREGFGPGVTSACFWAWEKDGSTKPGFPYVQSHGGGTAGPITIADIDGDGSGEIFTDHNILENGQGFLFGVDSSGHDLPGFPLRPQGFTYLNGAQIGDVDGDGDVELGVVSVDGTTVYVNLYDLAEAYEPARVPWATYHQTERRGGLAGGGDRLFLAGRAALGQQIRYTLVGEPGAAAFLWLSTSIAHSQDPNGWLHLAQPFRRTLFSGVVIPPTGQLTVPLDLPPMGPFSGFSFYAQGLELGFGYGRYTNLVGATIE